MGKRILMLLSNEYRPDPRVEKEASTLASSGFDVTVLCWDRERKRPREEGETVHVRRLAGLGLGGKVGMVLHYPYFTMRTIVTGLGMEFDAVHSHDLDTLLPGIILAKIKRRPLVYDAHEHYAKMVEDDLPGPAVVILDRIEKAWVRKPDMIIAANQRIMDYLGEWTAGRIVLVMNCIDLIDAGTATPGKRVIFYGGALEPKRYVMEIIHAAKGVEGYEVRVAGTGSLKPQVEEAAKAGNVTFLGYVGHSVLLDEMSRATLVIALLDPSNENNRIGTPNRLFEAMALGVPVLCTKGTLSGDIVTEEDCGLAIDWSEPEFRRVLDELRSNDTVRAKGRNGRRAAEGKYNWKIMGDRLVQAYRGLLGPE